MKTGSSRKTSSSSSSKRKKPLPLEDPTGKDSSSSEGTTQSVDAESDLESSEDGAQDDEDQFKNALITLQRLTLKLQALEYVWENLDLILSMNRFPILELVFNAYKKRKEELLTSPFGILPSTSDTTPGSKVTLARSTVASSVNPMSRHSASSYPALQALAKLALQGNAMVKVEPTLSPLDPNGGMVIDLRDT